MTAVAASGGRLVAVGSNGSGALTWTSSDGKAWSQVTAASDMAGAQALGVAVGSTIDAAVGTAPGTGKAGARPMRVQSHALAPVDRARASAGSASAATRRLPFVAGGRRLCRAIWSSGAQAVSMTLRVAGFVNGRQWSAWMPRLIRGRVGLAILAPTVAIAACSGSSSAWTPAPALPGAAGATLNAVTTGSADTSLFVAGGTTPVSGETGHAAAWSSTDGKTWIQAPDIPSFSQAQFLAVAPGPSGFMAVGASCANGECGGQMAWTSIDGHTWLQSQGIASAPGIIPQSRTVTADGSGWIVGGTWFTGAADNHPPAIWTTTDGATWTAATLPDATDASGAALLSGVVTGVATSSTRKVAVGSVDEGGGNRAAAWASADATGVDARHRRPLVRGRVDECGRRGRPGLRRRRPERRRRRRLDIDRRHDVAAGRLRARVRGCPDDRDRRRLAADSSPSATTAPARSRGPRPTGRAWSQMTAASDMAGAQALGVAVGTTTDVAVGSAPGSAKAWSLAH